MKEFLIGELDYARGRLDAKRRPNLAKTEYPRMELHDLGEVIKEIGEAVVAGIWMIFVLHLFFLQLLMQGGCTFFKAVVVILTAVEVDGHPPQRGLIPVRQNERTVLLPVCDLNRAAENRCQQLSQRSTGLSSGVEFLGRFRDQRGALRADRGEQFGMQKSKTQRAISAHGDAANGSIAPSFADTVLSFDQRDEFLQEKIAVAHRAVGRIDVETSSTFWSDDEELSHLVLSAEIVEQRPASTVKESSLVVSEAVQKIQHGIGLGRVAGSAGIVAGGKVNAIMDLVFQYPAVQSVAVDPALRMKPKGDSQRRDQEDDSKTARHRSSLLVA